MNGIILSVDTENLLILGENGNRYRFDEESWKSDQALAESLPVNFVLEGDVAKDVYLVPQQPQAIAQTANAEIMPLAMISLGLAIVGIFFFPLSIAAVVCGHIAKRHLKDPETIQTGDAYATWGLILGYGWIAFVIIGWLGFAGLLSSM